MAFDLRFGVRTKRNNGYPVSSGIDLDIDHAIIDRIADAVFEGVPQLSWARHHRPASVPPW
jgi:hypothetical protein